MKKKRRIVKRKKHIPKIENLYKEAYDKGMTVKEYVNYLAAMNMDRGERSKGGRRNYSTTYDMGPIPYRKEKDDAEE